MKSKRLLGLFLVIILACNDDDLVDITAISSIDECQEISDLGDIETLVESKSFIPYPDSSSKIIFTNNQGNEFEGRIIYNKISLHKIYTNPIFPCPIDTSIKISYEWMAEQKNIRIIIDSLDVMLYISISPRLHHFSFDEKLVADECRVVLYNPILSNNPSSQMLITINQRTHPNPFNTFTELKDLININGFIYEDVFIKKPDGDENYELLYNSEIGVVGFKKENNGYINFDRIE